MIRILFITTLCGLLAGCSTGRHYLLVDEGETFSYTSNTGRPGAYAEAKCVAEFGKHARRIQGPIISGPLPGWTGQPNIWFECVDSYHAAENEHCKGRENPEVCLRKIREKIKSGELEYKDVFPRGQRSSSDWKY